MCVDDLGKDVSSNTLNIMAHEINDPYTLT